MKLEGEGPWALRADGSVVPIQSHQGAAAARSSSSDGAPGTAPAPGQGQGPGAGAAAAAADDDVTLVFTPGHSRGHVCLYYAPAKVGAQTHRPLTPPPTPLTTPYLPATQTYLTPVWNLVLLSRPRPAGCSCPSPPAAGTPACLLMSAPD